MRYYINNEDLIVTANEIGYDEIYEQEYNEKNQHIKQVRLYLDKILNKEVTFDDIPKDLIAEVQKNYNILIESNNETKILEEGGNNL